ncbi:hypothetical protein GW17_00045777 [Ensete ventricosum]|nr:hypothetical protein GW17_00045777 [Ensete ventricosum]
MVWNSPGVCRELVEGVRSLPGWHKGVRQKKTESHRKIVGGSRKACLELGRKIARNTSGDRWRRIVRLATRNAGCCRIVGVMSLSLVVMYGCNP